MARLSHRAIVVAFALAMVVVASIDISSFMLGEASREGGVASVVNNVTIKVIAALFLIGMLQLFVRWDWARRFSGQISSHLTALGILGTFLGIFVGLYNFQVDRLDLAVPLLLEGMKVAFATSIAGLVASTILRISHSVAISIDPDDPFKPRTDFQNALKQGDFSVATAAMAGSGLTTDGLEFLIQMDDVEFERMMRRLVRLRQEIDEHVADLERRALAVERHREEVQRLNDEVSRAVNLKLRALEGS